MKLQAAIKLTQEDLPGVKSLLNQFPAQEPDSLVNIGCVYFKEGDYVSALKNFTAAMQMSGFEPQLLYNVALCHYKLKEYAPALKYIADIIERGIREHPELSVGMATEGLEVRSVGNTATLHSSALVEAFNLKAATEFQLKNFEGAREALTDMPPRAEAELDPVTLHNLALINTEENPTESFNKLQFLLQQQLVVQQEQETAGILACPPETFANLLLLYCKYEYYDMAADVLAEHADLTYKYLSNYMFDFLEALITEQTAPEEAYMKFDAMSAKYGENLRRAATQLTEAKRRQDPQAINSAAAIYEQAMDLYNL
nr:EOG090X0302 [Eulimnadia texana]